MEPPLPVPSLPWSSNFSRRFNQEPGCYGRVLWEIDHPVLEVANANLSAGRTETAPAHHPNLGKRLINMVRAQGTQNNSRDMSGLPITNNKTGRNI